MVNIYEIVYILNMKCNCYQFELISTYIKSSMSLIVLVIILSFFNLSSETVQAEITSDGNYVIKDNKVIDLRSGVEWLRCSVGQQFEDGNCKGEVLRLSQDEISEAILIANKELGGKWRLPSEKNSNFLFAKLVLLLKLTKLYSLVRFLRSYWTGQRNWISPKNLLVR